jgi:hypothetical protein
LALHAIRQFATLLLTFVLFGVIALGSHVFFLFTTGIKAADLFDQKCR